MEEGPHMAMSKEHKQALARGREQARAIKLYLDSLQPKQRGRPKTVASQKSRVEALRKRSEAEPDPLKKVQLLQARLDAEEELSRLSGRGDAAAAEREFIQNAAEYSARKAISYAAWREAGVPAAVLAKAGIRRTRRSRSS